MAATTEPNAFPTDVVVKEEKETKNDNVEDEEEDDDEMEDDDEDYIEEDETMYNDEIEFDMFRDKLTNGFREWIKTNNHFPDPTNIILDVKFLDDVIDHYDQYQWWIYCGKDFLNSCVYPYIYLNNHYHFRA